MNAPHPLVPNTDMVPIRNRPRFTTSEAVLLNALVNAAPEEHDAADID